MILLTLDWHVPPYYNSANTISLRKMMLEDVWNKILSTTGAKENANSVLKNSDLSEGLNNTKDMTDFVRPNYDILIW